ncbi:MAG: FISUMP domain-containing protein, partial [Bacteroidota bacterium]
MNFFYPVLACLLIASAIPLNVKAQTKTFVDPRDSNAYEIVELNDLEWLRENLRYRSPSNYDTLIAPAECGVFYLQEDAGKACPEGWRLPKEKEVKALLKLDKKGRLKLVDTLKIALCGRIDYGKHSKPGMQNTFWLDEDLV